MWISWSTWLSCSQPDGSIAFLTSSLASLCWPSVTVLLVWRFALWPSGLIPPLLYCLGWFPFLRTLVTWSLSLKNEHTAGKNTTSIRWFQLHCAELTSKFSKHENTRQTDPRKEGFFSCFIAISDYISSQKEKPADLSRVVQHAFLSFLQCPGAGGCCVWAADGRRFGPGHLEVGDKDQQR